MTSISVYIFKYISLKMNRISIFTNVCLYFNVFFSACLTMSDHSSGAEQGALPPSDGGPSTPTRVPTVVGIERSPVQLAQVIGGQYIITSQGQPNVPPLTQVKNAFCTRNGYWLAAFIMPCTGQSSCWQLFHGFESSTYIKLNTS